MKSIQLCAHADGLKVASWNTASLVPGAGWRLAGKAMLTDFSVSCTY